MQGRNRLLADHWRTVTGSTSTSNNLLDELVIKTFYESTVNNKRVKPSVRVLAALREMTLFLRPQMPIHSDLVASLLALIRECSDGDFDKKIIRMSIYLLCEMISNSSRSNLISLRGTVSNDILSTVKDEIHEHPQSIRSCLAFRHVGRLHFYDPRLTASTTELLIAALAPLKYPTEKKVKIFLSSKKSEREAELQIQTISNVLSGLHRLYRLQSQLLQLENYPLLTIHLQAAPMDSMIAVHILSILQNNCKLLESHSSDSTVLASHLTATGELLMTFLKGCKATTVTGPVDCMFLAVLTDLLRRLSNFPGSVFDDSRVCGLYEAYFTLPVIQAAMSLKLPHNKVFNDLCLSLLQNHRILTAIQRRDGRDYVSDLIRIVLRECHKCPAKTTPPSHEFYRLSFPSYLRILKEFGQFAHRATAAGIDKYSTLLSEVHATLVDIWTLFSTQPHPQLLPLLQGVVWTMPALSDPSASRQPFSMEDLLQLLTAKQGNLTSSQLQLVLQSLYSRVMVLTGAPGEAVMSVHSEELQELLKILTTVLSSETGAYFNHDMFHWLSQALYWLHSYLRDVQSYVRPSLTLPEAAGTAIGELKSLLIETCLELLQLSPPETALEESPVFHHQLLHDISSFAWTVLGDVADLWGDHPRWSAAILASLETALHTDFLASAVCGQTLLRIAMGSSPVDSDDIHRLRLSAWNKLVEYESMQLHSTGSAAELLLRDISLARHLRQHTEGMDLSAVSMGELFHHHSKLQSYHRNVRVVFSRRNVELVTLAQFSEAIGKYDRQQQLKRDKLVALTQQQTLPPVTSTTDSSSTGGGPPMAPRIRSAVTGDNRDNSGTATGNAAKIFVPPPKSIPTNKLSRRASMSSAATATSPVNR